MFFFLFLSLFCQTFIQLWWSNHRWREPGPSYQLLSFFLLSCFFHLLLCFLGFFFFFSQASQQSPCLTPGRILIASCWKHCRWDFWMFLTDDTAVDNFLQLETPFLSSFAQTSRCLTKAWSEVGPLSHTSGVFSAHTHVALWFTWFHLSFEQWAQRCRTITSPAGQLRMVPPQDTHSFTHSPAVQRLMAILGRPTKRVT